MNFIMLAQIENVMAGNQVKHSGSHVCALHTHFLFYSNKILIVVIMDNNYDMRLSILASDLWRSSILQRDMHKVNAASHTRKNPPYDHMKPKIFIYSTIGEIF